jgi:hypothetical protein
MKRILIVAILIIVILNFISFSPRITGYNTGGSGIASLTIMKTRPPCSFDLLPQWNFISICADAYNTSVVSMTSDFSSKYQYILRWNDTTQAYEVYSIYAIFKPFTEFDNNESYFLYMTDSAEWDINGTLRGDLALPLATKWNAPGYPYELTGNVSRYLFTIDGKYEYMMKWNATTQSYSLWSIYAIYKPFNQIFKGEGQFIYVNDTSALLLYNRAFVTS